MLRVGIVRIVAVPLAIALLSGCGGRRGGGTDGAAPRGGVVVERATLTHDGRERTYQVHVPRGARRAARRAAAVIVLHGGGGNADSAVRITGFSEKAADEGFVAVYPDGTGRRADRFLTWNAVHCCGFAMERGVDDVGFVDRLIDRLVADHPVDPDRVFVTGMSNGAMMAHRLGIELSDRIAGIAPVVGGLFGDEPRPDGPVAAIFVNGALDASVPPEGGPPGGPFRRSWDGTPLEPAAFQADFWARANGCEEEPELDEGAAVTRWVYGCPAGAAVVRILVKDNGHAWPGGERGSRLADRPSAALDATEAIWTFFERVRD